MSQDAPGDGDETIYASTDIEVFHERIRINHHLEHGSLFENKTYDSDLQDYKLQLW